MTRGLPILAASAALAAGCGGGGGPGGDAPTASPRAPTGTVEVGFSQTGPWNTVRTSVAVRSARVPAAWIANVPFAGVDEDRDFPDETIRTLPSGGIVLVAIGPHSYARRHEFPRLALPLTLSDGHVLTGAYEEQPAPYVSFFYVDRRTEAGVVNVWGYLGESSAGEDVRREADRMLAALRLDREP